MGKTSRHIKKIVIDQIKKRGFYQEAVDAKERLEAKNRSLEELIHDKKDILDYDWFVKPGHFYSPLVDSREGNFSHLVDLWSPTLKEVELPGITLNLEQQWKLLGALSAYSPKLGGYAKRQDVRFRFTTIN